MLMLILIEDESRSQISGIINYTFTIWELGYCKGLVLYSVLVTLGLANGSQSS